MRRVPPAGRMFGQTGRWLGPAGARGTMGTVDRMGTLFTSAALAVAVLAVAVLAVAAGPARANDDAVGAAAGAAAVTGAGAGESVTAGRSVWLAACGGRGGVQYESNRSVVDHPAYLATLGVQSDRHLLSARVTTVSSYTRTGDIALLYEHALVNGRWLVALGAGPGVRYYEALPPYDWQFPVTERDRPNFGLALSLQAVTRKHARWSGGAMLFGSVAGEQSFYGGGLIVQFGAFGAWRRAAAD